MKFKNPSNGYVEEISHPGLWCFLFGSLYFLVKGLWGHALVSLALAICTFGISWFIIYPFFAKEIFKKHYMRAGWQEID